MSEFPLWSDLIAQETPAKLQEMYPSPIEKGNPAPWMVSEDEMTDAQMKRREEIVKSMKDKEDDFKDRYGDRWKEVMYATATKQAMSEAEMISRAISPTPGPEMAEAVSSAVKCVDCGRALTSKEQKKASHTCDACDLAHRNKVDRRRAYGEAVQRPVRVGDYVHAGFAVKGGAGFSGRVDKVDGNWVYVNLGKDKSIKFSNDPKWGADWGDRIIKAPMKNVSLQEESTDSDYEAYFRGMLKKHGYDSPADIPDDKKDDFFNAVDAGYQAKNEGWASQSSHQYGVSAVDAQEDHDEEAPVESDDQDMMSAQLDSLAQKSATLHDILKHVALGDVPAWIQTKVANADKDVSAILDYMKYEEAEPVAEADEKKDAMVPLRMQAAMVIAKTLGGDRSASQQVDYKPSGGAPEAIVNQAIRIWLSGSHTNEGWALGAKMLKLAKQMGIKWDETLVRKKLAPITLKKLGLDEAEASAAPSGMERLRQQQEQEKNAMDMRHEREKLAQQQRDSNDKMQKQQQKQAEAQRTKQQARPAR
mgnify:CR=1 FL=1